MGWRSMGHRARPDRTEIVSLFEGFRGSFPALTMHLYLEHPHVDVLMEVPRQPDLEFDVTLNLQGDELHLSAGAFWLEWFPCTDSEVVARFQDAASGLLSGRYRILESAIGKRVVKAQLQRPDGDRWQTIGTWSNLGALLPWPRSTRVLQNRAADRATNA
jgi:hypothetical protein